MQTFIPKPALPPPRGSDGVGRWLRDNLFFSLWGTLVSLAGLGCLVWLGFVFLDWAWIQATWSADSRRECLTANPDGACWAGVIRWASAFIYGRYPAAEIWRVNVAFGLLGVWLLPLWIPGVSQKSRIAISALVFYPILGGYLAAGGDRGWFFSVILSLALAVFVRNWLHVVTCRFFRHSLQTLVCRCLGQVRPSERGLAWATLVSVFVLSVLVLAGLGHWTVPVVKTNLWGGLFLTFVVATTGVVLSVPFGIILALARRCRWPLIRVLAVAYIELLRSVPLITVLFMAVTMTPLLLPLAFNPDKLVMALIGISMFASAYMAEVVRGGLQAIPIGQIEAAQSIGLSYWRSMQWVVLPQALKHMIPNMASSFIGLLKDTTVVSMVGLYDFSLMLRAPGSHPTWIGLHLETLVVGGAVFFTLCACISRYALYLERTIGVSNEKLNPGH